MGGKRVTERRRERERERERNAEDGRWTEVKYSIISSLHNAGVHLAAREWSLRRRLRIPRGFLCNVKPLFVYDRRDLIDLIRGG